MKPTGPTNPVTRKLIESISIQGYKNKNKFLINLSKKLKMSARRRPSVNLSKIKRVSKEGETLVIPGKVLSYGELKKPVKIAALSFSKAAEKKVRSAGGTIMTIENLVKTNPKGTKVRLIQ